jgi:hypothetical protein
MADNLGAARGRLPDAEMRKRMVARSPAAPKRNPKQSLARFKEWQKEGICRFVGITSTFHGDFAAVESVLPRETPDFLQIDYSLDDRVAEKRLLPADRRSECGRADRAALRPRTYSGRCAARSCRSGQKNSMRRRGRSSSSNSCDVVATAGSRDKLFIATKLESPSADELKRSRARLKTDKHTNLLTGGTGLSSSERCPQKV